jgi:hypothetical protein
MQPLYDALRDMLPMKTGRLYSEGLYKLLR